MSEDLARNIERARRTIEQCAKRSGRTADDVKLVAVTKTHSAETVAQAARAGLRYFGENRVQEAVPKIARVRELVDIPLEWHLVGTLQRNKVRAALEWFDILQSVDSLQLAEAISRRSPGPPVPVLLEVYLGDDPQRPGFRPSVLEEAVAALRVLPGLDLRGLMTVAPLDLSPDESRTVFSQLRGLRDRLNGQHPGLGLSELSMGMTDDYPVAIEEGATIVRIGRAIFGARPS